MGNNYYKNSLPSSLESISKYNHDAFKTQVNTDYVKTERGIIHSILVNGDRVFAVIRKDDHHLSEDHGGIFNMFSYENIDDMLIPEIYIPTDILPVGNIVDRYVGKPVNVTVQNRIAIFASVLQSVPTLTTIDPSTIRKVRERLQDKSGEALFTMAARKIWNSFGVSEDDVSELKKLFFKTEDHAEKVVTVENEGIWGKDTNKQQSGETIIPASPLFNNLNGEGMKSNDCHAPTRIFSAK